MSEQNKTQEREEHKVRGGRESYEVTVIIFDLHQILLG
jgi:hypothetical protein